MHYSLSARARCSWTAEALLPIPHGAGRRALCARAQRERIKKKLFLIDFTVYILCSRHLHHVRLVAEGIVIRIMIRIVKSLSPGIVVVVVIVVSVSV